MYYYAAAGVPYDVKIIAVSGAGFGMPSGEVYFTRELSMYITLCLLEPLIKDTQN